MNYYEVFTFKHLYISYKKCIKGVRWKIETQRFINRDLILLNKIYKSLQNKTYKSDPFKEFDIIERGKPRHISAHTLKDRVVQRCLCDYYLVPLLSKSLIYDCGATIKGKGILFSQNRVNTRLQQYFRQNMSNQGYCLTIDFHHYFDSISHKILLNKLSKIILDKDLFNLLSTLIHNFKGDSGLGLGSQISQILALWYINDLDHYIKEKLHCKFYGRYMDDLYIIHKDKIFLYNCLNKIKEFIKPLNLELNKKTKIHKLSNGFTFTKIRYILTNTNRVLRFITTKTFKSMKRKIRLGININIILPSWIAYLSKFNCYLKLKIFTSIHFKDIILDIK